MRRLTYLKLLWLLPVLGLAVAWFFLLRPDFLGGPASYIIVSGQSMEPGLQSGDLAVLRERPQYQTGDVIAFAVGDGGAVIHRIVGGDAEDGFRTRGDNADGPDLWRPTPDDIGGSVWFSIPGIGRWIAQLRSPAVLAALSAALALVLILTGDDRRRPSSPTPEPGPRPALATASPAPAIEAPSEEPRQRLSIIQPEPVLSRPRPPAPRPFTGAPRPVLAPTLASLVQFQARLTAPPPAPLAPEPSSNERLAGPVLPRGTSWSQQQAWRAAPTNGSRP